MEKSSQLILEVCLSWHSSTLMTKIKAWWDCVYIHPFPRLLKQLKVTRRRDLIKESLYERIKFGDGRAVYILWWFAESDPSYGLSTRSWKFCTWKKSWLLMFIQDQHNYKTILVTKARNSLRSTLQNNKRKLNPFSWASICSSNYTNAPRSVEGTQTPFCMDIWLDIKLDSHLVTYKSNIKEETMPIKQSSRNSRPELEVQTK